MSIVLHLLFSLLLSLPTAHAQQGFLGVNFGLTDSGGPNTPKEVAFAGGGRAGFIFYEHVSIGAFAHYYTSHQNDANTAYLPLLAEVLFYPHHTPNDKNTYYLGAQFGTTHLVISDVKGKRTDNATTFGICAGYSISLGEGYSLGPELQYLFVYADDDNFKMTLVQASFKMMF